jgi:hypothetical protein
VLQERARLHLDMGRSIDRVSLDKLTAKLLASAKKRDKAAAGPGPSIRSS